MGRRRMKDKAIHMAKRNRTKKPTIVYHEVK
jgi:hypothetical protein